MRELSDLGLSCWKKAEQSLGVQNIAAHGNGRIIIDWDTQHKQETNLCDFKPLRFGGYLFLQHNLA